MAARAVFAEKLIEEVKKYPWLYDTSRRDFRDVRKKRISWNQVGVVLNEDGEFYAFQSVSAIAQSSNLCVQTKT